MRGETRELAGAMVFDRLEDRRLLANVPVGIVDFRASYFSEWDTFAQATIGFVDDGGFLNIPGAGGHVERVPMTRRDDGRLQLSFGDVGFAGFPVWDFGAQFLPEDGFALGWWTYNAQVTMEPPDQGVRLFVPLAPEGTPVGTLFGEWSFTAWTTSAFGAGHTLQLEGEASSGSFLIDTASRRIDWTTTLGDAFATTSTVQSWGGVNSFGTSDGLKFFLSSDGHTLIFAETSTSNSTVTIGVATRARPAPSMEAVAGTYLTFLRSDQFNVNDEEAIVTLSEDGSYRVRPGYFYLNTEETGTWAVVGNEVRMTAGGSGVERRFLIGSNGGTLLPIASIEGDDTNPIFGLATRRVTEEGIRHDPVVMLPGVNEDGEAIVWLDRSNEAWAVINLAAASGGPQVSGEIVTWFDPTTGQAHAAGIADVGVVVYREIAPGTWTYQVLSNEVGSEVAAFRSLTMAVTPNGQINLFALTEQRQLLRYFSISHDAVGEVQWGWQNLTTGPLAANGQTAPVLRDGMVAYATRWGGLNVAGTTSNGELYVVWWAPRSGGWFASDLSAMTRSATLAGDLAVSLTPWGGINITGVNSIGQVVVNWWAPALGSEWKLVNLTRGTDRARLGEDHLEAIFVPRESAVVIAGLNGDTGDVVIYYWRLTQGANPGWSSVNITVQANGDASTRIVEHLRASISAEGDVNISGVNADGETVRYWTQVRVVMEGWYVENLTVDPLT